VGFPPRLRKKSVTKKSGAPTVRFGEYLFRRPKLPEIRFGLDCIEKLEISLAKHHLKLSKQGG